MNGRNRHLLAHLALALSRYNNELRREGLTAPRELLALADFLTDCATVRQDATPDAASTRPGEAEGMKKHPLLTKRETAAALRSSVRTVERLIQAGALPAVKVEGGTRIRLTDLETYIAGLGSGPSSFRDSVEEKSA